MHDKEVLDMMRRCVSDIKQLRAERDHLAPAAEAYGVIRDIMRLVPKPSQGYGEDIVWTLEKRIRELETADKEPKT
jgi:hypothetical protein